jgi:hypothetical protein
MTLSDTRGKPMTAAEAIQSALNLPQDVYSSEISIEVEALRVLLRHSNKATKAATLKYLLERVEAFRRSDAPGHAVHYERHLRVAAWAAERLDPNAASAA